MLSGDLDCIVCHSGSCPPGITLFTISDGNANTAPVAGADEVRCWDTLGTSLDTTNSNTYYETLLRVSEPTNAHVQENTYSNYPLPIYLSSNYFPVQCDYLPDCSSYNTCVVSISEETNAHVSDCAAYSTKLCCSLIAVTIPISNYSVQYKASWSDGSLIRDWNDWLYQTTSLSDMFGSSSPIQVQNNQTYFFRVNASDLVGNTGSYSEEVNTTVDTELPNIPYPPLNDDKANKRVTIDSAAWDNVSGIFNHTINCTVINPPSIVFVQCPQAAQFGGISSCQTPQISYSDETEISCEIRAQDRAGNIYSRNIFFTSAPNNLIMKLHEHNIFISIGESYHVRIELRNIKSIPDMINISLQGTYPPGLARFLQSSPIIWMSSDQRNVTALLNPYEQKTIYVEIISTDQGDYTLDLQAGSQTYPIRSNDSLSIMIGFPAAFPGIEIASILILFVLSGLFYWKIR